MADIITLAKELISCPSFVDGNNTEEKLIDLIVDKLRENKKLNIFEQPVEGRRRNLIVTDGANPKTILFGHMDTVLPPKKERYSSAVFEEDGKIYGLGSCDMKSGLAVMLDAAINHHYPGVGYIFSVDEEYDFKGAAKLKEIDTIHPEVIINLEPTDLKILNGCRGLAEFELEVYGTSAHAGVKQCGVNAIEGAVRLVADFENECRKYDNNRIATSVNLAYLLGGLESDEGGEVKKMGNVVPNYAKVIVEVRIGNQAIDKQFINAALEKLACENNLKITEPQYKFFYGPMFTDPSKLKGFENAIRASKLDPVYADIGSTGYYELQLLQAMWGGNCVIFGASPINKSHGENEYVEVQSLLKLQEVIDNFLKAAHGGD